MGLLVSLLFVYMTFPLRQIKSIEFDDALHGLWGLDHQSLDQDGILTLELDSNSGSGFKSKNHYLFGYFGAAIKLHRASYTAGLNTNIYLSNNQNHPGNHDEVDIEFLGHQEGKPYTLQTNVYIRGSGDGPNVIGREVKFHLWFDPTADFHNYAILWTSDEILFFVDDTLIRKYPKIQDMKDIFPKRPMWVYGSIWDASSWATENGTYKIDYHYGPFFGKYKNFILHDCSGDNAAMCQRLSRDDQQAAKNYMVYNYCEDPQRDRTLTPECSYAS